MCLVYTGLHTCTCMFWCHQKTYMYVYQSQETISNVITSQLKGFRIHVHVSLFSLLCTLKSIKPPIILDQHRWTKRLLCTLPTVLCIEGNPYDIKLYTYMYTVVTNFEVIVQSFLSEWGPGILQLQPLPNWCQD